MIWDAPPPAISAPVMPCGDGKHQRIWAGDETVVLHSPDCRWILAYRPIAGSPPASPLKEPLAAEMATVADAVTGKVVATFEMSRSANLHWLDDGTHLIVNYLSGSGSAEPLVILLPSKPQSAQTTAPIDLSEVVFNDVLKRIGKSPEQVYHFYAYFTADKGDRVLISAEPVYTLRGEVGPGASACLIYSIDKATFRDARLIEQLPETTPCPNGPAE
ncbi:MAG: hypothetical protein ABMA14_23300 [Hyphomonadaceae bacterium]